MTTKQNLHLLIDKNFSLYQFSDFIRRINFLDVINILVGRSDFFEYRFNDQEKIITKWLKESIIFVDANTYIKIN